MTPKGSQSMIKNQEPRTKNLGIMLHIRFLVLGSRFCQVDSPHANPIASAGSAGNSSRPCQATSPAVSAKLTTQPNASSGSAITGHHLARPSTEDETPMGLLSSWVFCLPSKYLSQPTSAPSSTSMKAQITQLGGATFIQPKRAQNEP